MRPSEPHLTTEGLNRVIYGETFNEPHADAPLYEDCREAAAGLARKMPRAAAGAAKAAIRRHCAGARVRLAGRAEALFVWQAPSLYIQLRRGKSFVVLRVESLDARYEGWIHEIGATAPAACGMLAALDAVMPRLNTVKAFEDGDRLLIDPSLPRSMPAVA